MMRTHFLFLALAACISAMKREDLKKTMKDCDMFLEERSDSNPISDPGAKVKSQCILRKLEILDEHGIIQKDKLKTRIADLITDNNTDYAARIFDWCFVEKADLQSTALHLANNCFNNFSRKTYDPPVQSEALLANFQCIATVPVTLKEEVVTNPIYELARFKCLAETVGVIDTDGKIDKEVARRVLTEELIRGHKESHFSSSSSSSIPKMVDMIIQECMVEKESPEKTVTFMSKCLYSIFTRL